MATFSFAESKKNARHGRKVAEIGGTKALIAAFFKRAQLRAFSRRTCMAKKSFVRKTQRTIVGAAKSGAARVQKIAIKAATAAATAAAEAAVEEVMKSMHREGQARGQTMAAERPVRRTKRKQARKTSQRKRR
jgi:hypothetical protein